MSNEQFVVIGLITDTNKQPLQGIRVLSIDKDLRGETRLGDQITDHDGNYEIRYSFQQLSHAEKQSPNLYFKLFDPRGEELSFTNLAVLS